MAEIKINEEPGVYGKDYILYFGYKIERPKITLLPNRFYFNKKERIPERNLASYDQNFIEKFEKYARDNMIHNPDKPLPEEGQPDKLVVRAFPNWDWDFYFKSLYKYGYRAERTKYIFHIIVEEFWTYGKFKRDPLPFLKLHNENIYEEQSLYLAIEISKDIVKKPEKEQEKNCCLSVSF
jgi:hypothetical protein